MTVGYLKYLNGREIFSKLTNQSPGRYTTRKTMCAGYEMLTKDVRSGFLLLVQIKTLKSDARDWTPLRTLENGCFSQNTVGIRLHTAHRTSLELKSTCN